MNIAASMRRSKEMMIPPHLVSVVSRSRGRTSRPPLGYDCSRSRFGNNKAAFLSQSGPKNFWKRSISSKMVGLTDEDFLISKVLSE